MEFQGTRSFQKKAQERNYLKLKDSRLKQEYDGRQVVTK